MIKKIISITLVLLFTLSALSSCEGAPAEDSAPETTLSVPATTDEPVLYSFYAIEKTYKQGYVVLGPLDGSVEAEKWDYLYLTDFTDGTPCPRLAWGEIVEVVYSGEIEAMPNTESGHTQGYIKNVHSMRIKVDAREYGGIDYGVAFMQEGHRIDEIRKIGLTAGKEGVRYGMLLAASRNELDDLIGNYFMIEGTADEYSSEQIKESVARMNQRDRLLEVYDGEFFKDNDLLMIFIKQGIGYMEYDITDITLESGILTVNIELDGRGADNVEYWIIFVSIPKEINAQITEYRAHTTPERYN